MLVSPRTHANNRNYENKQLTIARA